MYLMTSQYFGKMEKLSHRKVGHAMKRKSKGNFYDDFLILH